MLNFLSRSLSHPIGCSMHSEVWYTGFFCWARTCVFFFLCLFGVVVWGIVHHKISGMGGRRSPGGPYKVVVRFPFQDEWAGITGAELSISLADLNFTADALRRLRICLSVLLVTFNSKTLGPERDVQRMTSLNACL